MNKPTSGIGLSVNNSIYTIDPHYNIKNEQTHHKYDDKGDALLIQYQQNDQLFKQLCFLLAHDDVRNGMSYALHSRVQKIIDKYSSAQSSKSTFSKQRKILGQLTNNNQKFGLSLNKQVKDIFLKQQHNFSSTKQFLQNQNRNIKIQSQSIDGPSISEDEDGQFEQLFPPKHYLKEIKQKQISQLKQNSKIIKQFGDLRNSKDKLKRQNKSNSKFKSKSKQKEQTNKCTLVNSKNIKQLKQISLKTPCKSQSKIKAIEINSNKIKISKTKTIKSKQKETKQRENQEFCKKTNFKAGNTTIKKQKYNGCKLIRSASVTAYTTRNNEGRESEKYQNTDKNKRSIEKLKGETQNGKINIINSIHNVEIKNNIQKLRKHHTEHFDGEKQNNQFYRHQFFDQQFYEKKLKDKGKETRRKNEKQRQTSSLQFVSRIEQLQKIVFEEQIALQQKVKFLKSQLSAQKSTLEDINNSISQMKQNLKNIYINNSFLANKKKQNRSKLEHVWNQVKILNSALSQSNIQNTQISESVIQEKELIHMYNTVIQQLRAQLKIQSEQRDFIKKQLKQSKKNQHAFKLKVTATKDRTDSILNNVKESISKWIT